MKYIIGLLIVAGLIYAGGTFSRPKSDTAIPSRSPEAMMEESAGETMMAADENLTVINVTGQNFRFNPETITVNQGDRVRVVLTALDMPHDFDLDELGVDGPVVAPGETAEVEFTADQTGEFEYYCSVGQHRANGMTGTLIVR